MEQIALEISAMESSECERAVTSALINISGVYWATADHATEMVGISYDPVQVDSNELRDAVQVAGYATVDPVKNGTCPCEVGPSVTRFYRELRLVQRLFN